MPKTSHHKKAGVKLDDFHRHEALDRVSVWLDHFSEYIAAHPVIVASPDYAARCEKITDLCGELYQAIGNEIFDFDVSRSMRIPAHNPNLVVPTDGFHDPDATNGLRARSAANALAQYQSERELDADRITCSIDLLTDLLHFLHSQNENPIHAIEKARNHFLNEALAKQATLSPS